MDEIETLKAENKKILALLEQKKDADLTKLQLEIEALNKKLDLVVEDISQLKKKVYPVDTKKLKELDTSVRSSIKKAETQVKTSEALAKKVQSMFSEINERYASIIKIKTIEETFRKKCKIVEKQLKDMADQINRKADKKRIKKLTQKYDKKIKSVRSRKKKKGLFR